MTKRWAYTLPIDTEACAAIQTSVLILSSGTFSDIATRGKRPIGIDTVPNHYSLDTRTLASDPLFVHLAGSMPSGFFEDFSN